MSWDKFSLCTGGPKTLGFLQADNITSYLLVFVFIRITFFLELIPLIFWQRVTHSLALDLPCVSITTNKEYIAMGDHIASICPVRKEHLNWHNNVWKRTRDIENTLFMITIRNPYNSRARIRAQISKCVI
jgi:hypothetical protein